MYNRHYHYHHHHHYDYYYYYYYSCYYYYYYFYLITCSVCMHSVNSFADILTKTVCNVVDID